MSEIQDKCLLGLTLFNLFFIQIAKRLKDSVQSLGNSLTVTVQTAGNVQAGPNDPFAKKELSENAKKVVEKVGNHRISYIIE